MWPQGNSCRTLRRGHAIEVALERIEFGHQNGRVEFGLAENRSVGAYLRPSVPKERSALVYPVQPGRVVTQIGVDILLGQVG